MLTEEKTCFIETKAFWILWEMSDMSLNFLLVFIVVLVESYGHLSLHDVTLFCLSSAKGSFFPSMCSAVIWIDSIVSTGVGTNFDPDSIKCAFCPASFTHLEFQLKIKFDVALLTVLWGFLASHCYLPLGVLDANAMSQLWLSKVTSKKWDLR